MTRSEQVEVATNALRQYAESLSASDIGSREPTASVRPTSADDSYAGRIRRLISELEQNKIPVEAWGAPGAQPSPVGPSHNEYHLISGPAPDHYVKFRAAYEAAHEAMVERLRNLAELYETTADAYRATAKEYDAMDDNDG